MSEIEDWELKDARNEDRKCTALLDLLKANSQIGGLKDLVVSELSSELELDKSTNTVDNFIYYKRKI